MDKKETTRLLDSLINYNIVDINNMRSQFPELGDAFMNVILAIDQEYGSGSIDKDLLKTPTATTLPIQVGDYFTSLSWDNDNWVKITEIVNSELRGIDESKKDYVIKLPDAERRFETGKFAIIPNPELANNATVNQLPYKVGDYFTGLSWPNDEWVKITEIELTGINTNYSNGYVKGINNKGTDYVAPLDNFNQSWDAGLLLYLISNPTANQVSFKLGDLFTVKGYSQDIYVINEMGSDKVGIRNTTNNNITRAGYPSTEKSFKSGEYILLPPTSVKNPNISIGLTGWTKDWKANGLRPSPTRKASLELIDAVGMGNDGNVYLVVTDKNGTKKWKKTRFAVFADSTRQAFTELYDLQLLYDQLVYENSQLSRIDYDYDENQKLITKLIEEIKTK